MPRTQIEVVIPTFVGNIDDVESNLSTIWNYCQKELATYSWRITLAYNGNPGGLEKANQLAKVFSHVRVTYVNKPGKGNALLNGLRDTPATYLVYFDADLATDLHSLPLLIRALDEGAALASGSRYHSESTIKRDWIRLLVSKVYTILFLKMGLNLHARDPQCGFKALNVQRMRPIVNQVEDSWFFFETELTYGAEARGMKVVEVPVVWVERSNSSVQLVPTIQNFIKNWIRLRLHHRVKRIHWKESVVTLWNAGFSSE